MANVYSVAQINQYIKNMFQGDLLLRDVQIQGEISNIKYHSSGHIYFTLKEAGSAISAVMFKSARYQGLGFTLENGQNVIVCGNVAVYERDGKYQVYAREIKQDGLGYLYEEYERLKQKLYDEGLFDFEHKKEIPKYPKKIGIVTAKTGAAIQDICNIAKRRNPYVQLYLYPAKVQGDGAAQTIVDGIHTLDQMGVDTIIIGRGGGSIEDLWAFNEEIVARAIYAANTPIISGTGHEIDNTIADYVADLRAPTPSAACELAICDVMESVHRLKQQERELKNAMNDSFVRYKQRILFLQAGLERVSPENCYKNQKIYRDTLQDQLQNVIRNKFQSTKHRYEMLLTKLDGLSPTSKLTGGYGYLSDEKQQSVKSVFDVQENDTVYITLWDGTIQSKVVQIDSNMEKENG